MENLLNLVIYDAGHQSFDAWAKALKGPEPALFCAWPRISLRVQATLDLAPNLAPDMAASIMDDLFAFRLAHPQIVNWRL